MFLLLTFFSFLYTMSHEDIIYKNFPIFIPIGIITYLIILIIRSYSNCKIKWITDLKFISAGKLLSIYGITGAFICFIICLITTFVDCGNNKLKLCFTEKNGKYTEAKNIKKGTTTSATIKKLKKSTKYYLKIKSYKKIGNYKEYSSFSKAKSIKTTK